MQYYCVYEFILCKHHSNSCSDDVYIVGKLRAS